MGDILQNRIIIKNIGMLMGLITGCVALVYTALNLGIVILDGSVGIALKSVGVIILSIFAYLPYYFLYKIINRVRFIGVFVTIGVVFFVGNIVLLVGFIVSFSQISGLIGLIIYSIFFMSVLIVLMLCDKLVSWCIYGKNICYRIRLDIMRNIETLVNKKKI